MTLAPFDPKAAVDYGRFVQAAYTMYHGNPGKVTPPPSSDVPAGYELAAWITMQDFVIESTDPVFYGFIAHSLADTNRLVLAIRGTSDGIEWWDDADAILKIPFKVPGCGEVGLGFARIYDTLEVIEHPIDIAAAAPRSLKEAGGFSRQVSELVRRRATDGPRAEEAAAPVSIEVTGHSLGAALATLYAMENAKTDKVPNPVLCTFASPFVGDSTFAAVFNDLQLTSWRIVNAQDIVPMLPPEILGFTHVATEQKFSSIGKVRPSFACWHALATYLYLIDPALQPGADCQLTGPRTTAAAPATVSTLSVPAGFRLGQHHHQCREVGASKEQRLPKAERHYFLI